MLAHYSHVRLAAKRTALDGLATKPTIEGYATKRGSEADSGARAIEKMVELVGIELQMVVDPTQVIDFSKSQKS